MTIARKYLTKTEETKCIEGSSATNVCYTETIWQMTLMW